MGNDPWSRAVEPAREAVERRERPKPRLLAGCPQKLRRRQVQLASRKTGLVQWAPLALRFNHARANARSRVFILAAPDDTRRS